ncbi:FecR domain-containing protein [Fulvivirgaceae bacterium BMA10]|uniref:FecR domain-containing protein n=1 Tax=Splendidivirga corallicola TaxID=3051826 RepID=A0ABT8KH90_9BACT|nr:FecR domain-containing protein [Fulvivirgaceae bacterium BMA10]
MKYEDYSTVDFIKDEYFIRWVKDPDEQSDKFWKMWMAKHPEKREECLHARNMISDMGYQYDPELTEGDYVEMFEGVLKKSRQASLKQQRYNSSILSRTLKIAAVLAIILLSVFGVLRFLPIEQSQVVQLPVITKKSPMGQKTTTWLDDGTKVHLNAGSDISYPERFSDTVRVVYLKGEAYFEVTKDAERPFIVKTGNVQTTVLGTAFNVRAYPDESKINVAVVEGKVRVENSSSIAKRFKYTITRNQMTSYDLSSQRLTKEDFDPDEILAWTKGIIHFKGANINEIIRTLERWYGVTFVVNRQLNRDKDFSIIYKNKSLTEILEGLSFAFEFEFEINDKTVILN